MRQERIDASQMELVEKVVSIKRVTKDVYKRQVLHGVNRHLVLRLVRRTKLLTS